MSEKKLENKVAWVTGSSRGIGRVIAGHLASLGAKVAVHGTSPTSTRAFNEADSLEAAVASAAAHVRTAGYSIDHVQIDDADLAVLSTVGHAANG